jgi:hypothetical protein
MNWVRGGALLGRIIVGVGSVCLVAVSPPLREAAIQLQPSVPGVLATVALAGAFLSFAIRWRAGRARRLRWLRCERTLGMALARWGWVGAILVALLPLWSHWTMRPPDALSAHAALLGHIPWQDTRLHLEGALHLLSEGDFGLYSERRPLTAAWLAARLVASGGGKTWALTIQAVFFGLALFALGRIVGSRLGPWSALMTCGVTLGLAAGFLPTFATEPLGVTLAACALALLLSRASMAPKLILAAGVYVLGLALGARPGPQLVLPAFVLWGIAVARHRARLRVAALLVGAAAAAVLSTGALNVLYGKGESSLSANAAYTLYGLSGGSNYRQFLRDYGEATMRAQGDREVSRWLYEKTFENLRERPGDFVRALASNLRKFVGKLPSNLAAAMTIAPLFQHPAIESETLPDFGGSTSPAGLAALILATGAGLFFFARRCDPKLRLFWLAFALAVLGSVPIVYGDASFRGLAVTYPFFGVALGLGLCQRRSTAGSAGASVERPALRLAVALPLLIVIAAITVPGIARSHWPRPVASTLAGLTAREDMVIDVRNAPAVLVSHSPRKGLARVPWLSPADYRRLLAFGGFVDNAGIEHLPPPFVVTSGYDFVTQQQYVLIGPLDLLRQSQRFARLRVRPLGTGGKIYQAESCEPIAAPSGR